MCYKNNILSGVLVAAVAFIPFIPLGSLAAPPAASAQGGGTFSGTLVDAVGRVLPDRPLTLTNVQTGARHQTRSDGSGRFTFAALDGGDYTLDATVPGFAGSYRLSLASGQQLQRDVALQVGAVHETVAIQAGERLPPRPRAAVPSTLADAGSCDQSVVGGCIDPPTKIIDVKPRYPMSRLGSSAVVTLEGRIGTDGFVSALRVVGAVDADFANAAVDAVGQWQFTPTRLDGVPVETVIEITVRFDG
ncbi:MAG TPA: TonB family protein [Vicinamibacterales bacterium]|jgi:TonB family protein|nr:TonB family protein [Vicinamibacterales bacterium]